MSRILKKMLFVIGKAAPGGLDEHCCGEAEADQQHSSPRRQDTRLLHGRT